ncbi:MAG TPA: bifunctional nuclease family protein [Kofleriaceae bacterium]
MRMLPIALLLLGCVAPAPPPPVAPPPAPVHAEPSEPVGLPAGYVEMKPDRVMPIQGQGALLLVDEPSNRMVPIFIGGTEAASIDGRMRGAAPPRPLTHDLLDHVLAALGGQLVQVQVDEIRDDTYIGSIYIRTKGRVIKLDSRASDAVALAIGGHVPIYVAKKVIDEAGLDWNAVQQQINASSDVRGT